MSKSIKLSPILNLLFKVGIALTSMGYVLYNLFFRSNEFSRGDGGEKVDIDIHYILNFLESSLSAHSSAGISLVILLLLVALNWGGEVLKWRRLVHEVQPASWGLAWKSILSGVAMSNITPYRIGGYVARVALLPHENRLKAVSYLLLGDFAQLLVGVLAGSIATLMLISQISIESATISTLEWAAWILLLNGFNGTLIFLGLKVLSKRLIKIKILKRWSNTIQGVQKTSHEQNALVLLGLSTLRFVVILLQYYLAYTLFGWNIDFITTLLVVAAFLLIYNFLPTFNLFEFGMTKTAILLFLLETFYGKSCITFELALLVSCSSFLIWLINLAIPALVGSIFVFNMNLFRNHNK